MPMSIFRVKTVLGANITGFVMGTILFSMFLLLTLYMQQVLAHDAAPTRASATSPSPAPRSCGRTWRRCSPTGSA